MGKSKYDKFTKYLYQSGEKVLTLNYDEIEKILGYMPKSALIYNGIWHDKHGSPFSQSWVKAGYTIINDFKNKKATFTKKQEVECEEGKKEKVTHSTKLRTLDIDDAIEAIKAYHNEHTIGEFTRYRSWEHCYNFFQNNWNKLGSLDLLSLHLSWYLASWGMLRGSSFLIQHDYKIHYDVIKQLTAPEFEPLFTVPSIPNIEIVIRASNIIKSGYGDYLPSDTLITKILLGIYGCTPAYDRYFKASAIKYDICSSNFSKESLTDVWVYYTKHKVLLENLRKELKTASVEYTPMKLMDMALFQLGISNN